MKPDKTYLDSNLLVDFYRRLMRKKRFEYPEIIDFLTERKELPKFISSLSLLEIGAVTKKEFPAFTLKDLENFTKSLIDTIGLEVIYLPEINWKNALQYAMLCHDARNSLHIDIARSRDLWFITRDKDDPRVKSVYPKVMGENKFRKQFD